MKAKRRQRGKGEKNSGGFEEAKEVVAKKLTAKEKNALSLCIQHKLQEVIKAMEICQQNIEALQLQLRLCSDPADKSQVESDLAKAVKTRERLQFISRECHHAIDKINKGLYGICENPDCEEQISLARLQANPEARLCLECQRAFEAKAARHAHPHLAPYTVTI